MQVPVVPVTEKTPADPHGAATPADAIGMAVPIINDVPARSNTAVALVAAAPSLWLYRRSINKRDILSPLRVSVHLAE